MRHIIMHRSCACYMQKLGKNNSAILKLKSTIQTATTFYSLLSVK